MKQLRKDVQSAIFQFKHVFPEAILAALTQRLEVLCMNTSYETDYTAWAESTVALLRQRRFEEIDLEALIEEVDGLAKSDPKAIRSQLRRLLLHLLKWKYSSTLDRERAGRGWSESIVNARNEIDDIIGYSPSLRTYPSEVLDAAYQKARKQAAVALAIELGNLPEACPWSIEKIFEEGWLPE